MEAVVEEFPAPDVAGSDNDGVLPDTIEGPTLTLRRWRTADAPDLCHLIESNLEHLRPWMAWIADEPLTVAQRVRMIEDWEDGWAAGGDAVLAVAEGAELVGSCGLHRRAGPDTLEIGYWVDHRHLRRGIASEVARLLTGAALAVPGITGVEIHHDKANVASGRVPAGLGYRWLGESVVDPAPPGRSGVDWAWRMDAADWTAPAATR